MSEFHLLIKTLQENEKNMKIFKRKNKTPTKRRGINTRHQLPAGIKGRLIDINEQSGKKEKEKKNRN